MDPPPPQEGVPSEPGPDWKELKGKLAAAPGPERLILIAGALFLVDSFLPWYGVSGSFDGFGFSANVNGWNSGGLAVIAILLGIAATLLVLLSTIGMQMPVQATGPVLLGLCGGALLFVLLRLLTETSFTKYGLYLALVLTAVMTYAAWVRNKAAAS